MPGSRPLRPGEPERLGGYRLLAGLGEGGQGVVYLAESPAGARVAIKVLHARFASDDHERERFLREVDAATRVAAFCTARVLDVAVDGDRPYVVSEYVEGVSLEELVQADGPRVRGALDRIAVGTATALAAIHKAGIVHRDFKPSNVLLGPDGPRVIDFGIARPLDNATTTQGVVTGTPSYMSPEQISGTAVGPPSDIFSWAITMAFAAIGTPPFGEDAFPAVMYRIVTTQPDLAGVPEPLRTLLLACLAKAAHERPTAPQVLDTLLGHGDSLPVTQGAGAAFPGAAAPGGSGSQISYWPVMRETAALAPSRHPFPPRQLIALACTALLAVALAVVVSLLDVLPPGARTATATPRASASVSGSVSASVSAPPFGTPVGRPLTGNGGEVNTVAVSTLAGRTVAVGGSTAGTARMWDLLTGHTAGTPLADPRADIDVGQAGGRPVAVLRYPGGRLRVRDLASARDIGPLYTGHTRDVYATATTELRGTLVVISGDVGGQVRVWNPLTGRDVWHQNAHTAAVYGVTAGTLDGRPVVLSAAADDVVRVWDLAGGGQLTEFRGHTGDAFTAVTAELEGTPVGISGGSDDMVRIWDLRNGQAIGQPFRGHTADVAALAAGRLHGRAVVASGGFDGTVRVWDLVTGKRVGTPLKAGGDRVYSLAMVENQGRTLLVSGGRDATVRVWSLGAAL